MSGVSRPNRRLISSILAYLSPVVDRFVDGNSEPYGAGQAADLKSDLPLATLRILLVEDSPDQQRLYSMMLRKAGADVRLECNGRAAVKTVLAASSEFDVVIMDMVMPLLDGVAATRELRQQAYAGPILAFTARPEENTRAIWFQAGCSAYLAKPLAMPTLIDTLIRLLDLDGRALSLRPSQPLSLRESGMSETPTMNLLRCK